MISLSAAMDKERAGFFIAVSSKLVDKESTEAERVVFPAFKITKVPIPSMLATFGFEDLSDTTTSSRTKFASSYTIVLNLTCVPS